jgi:hypothetical protein
MRNHASLKAAPAISPRPSRPDYPHQACAGAKYADLDTSSSADNGKAMGWSRVARFKYSSDRVNQ